MCMTGRDDELVLSGWGERTAAALLRAGEQVQFRAYPMLGHEVGEEQVQGCILACTVRVVMHALTAVCMAVSSRTCCAGSRTRSWPLRLLPH